MDINERIAQFEHMAREDPDNDMAHFSLGNAYVQAGRHEDAAASFERCYSLNPAMSKAYQLAAESLLEAGDEQKAKAVATEGYVAAAERGDMLPRDAMGEVLERLGAPVPEVETKEKPAGGGGDFVCARTGRAGTQLDKPPFKGPVGAWIQQNIAAETWREWIGQGTKVINELRLDLSNDEDAETYDRHMREFLGIDDDLLERLRNESSATS